MRRVIFFFALIVAMAHGQSWSNVLSSARATDWTVSNLHVVGD